MKARNGLGSIAGLLGCALLCGSSISTRAQQLPSLDDLTKYRDELPIPPTLRPTRAEAGKLAELTIPMEEVTSSLHAGLPASKTWAYAGSSPGPTIEVESGQALTVHWQNRLPTTHLLPAPNGAEMSMPGPMMPDVRAVVHLHGAFVDQPAIPDRFNNNDGWPDSFTVPGETQTAVYPNRQESRALWYHDHAIGETGRNVAAGLVGLYLVRDELERSLNLPSVPYEIPLLIQAKGVQKDGSLSYTDDLANEFYGNAIAVNGKLWPYLRVEPRKYRFRMVNASNARAFGLSLQDANDASAGPAMIQIGTDGGFLPAPVPLSESNDPLAPRLKLAPAERADVIVDFSQFAGHSFTLRNRDPKPARQELYLPEVMQIRVDLPLSGPDKSVVPTRLRPVIPLLESQAVTTRRIDFVQAPRADGSSRMLLNGKAWTDPITETPVAGTTEIWELVNPQEEVHPFHIHQAEFQVLDRRRFDSLVYLKTGAISFIADATLPEPDEGGWKDVVRVSPFAVTRIIVRFDQRAGYSIYHCHILEHEDMDMMRPMEILPAAQVTSGFRQPAR